LTLAKEKLAESNYADAPIIIAGDFNSMSHLITLKMQLINMGILLTGQRASTSLLLGLLIPFESSIPQ